MISNFHKFIIPYTKSTETLKKLLTDITTDQNQNRSLYN